MCVQTKKIRIPRYEDNITNQVRFGRWHGGISLKKSVLQCLFYITVGILFFFSILLFNYINIRNWISFMLTFVLGFNIVIENYLTQYKNKEIRIEYNIKLF